MPALSITMSAPYLTQFLTIALVHLLAVASPGPDFAVIVRQSITYGKKTALWSSLGLGFGILSHVCYTMLGIGVLISHSIIAFNIMKTVGALYLVYIGIKCLKASPQSSTLDFEQPRNALPTVPKAIWTGFLTNGLNPKATLFFLSLYTVVITPQTPLVIQGIYGVYMAVATVLWFSMLSLFFGNHHIRSRFLRIGHWFERTTGAVLILLGIKLATTGHQ